MNTQGTNVTRIARTSISLPEPTLAAIRELAEKGDRSLSREVRRAIERYVEQERAAA